MAVCRHVKTELYMKMSTSCYSAVRDYPVVLNIDRACAHVRLSRDKSDKNPSRTQ